VLASLTVACGATKCRKSPRRPDVRHGVRRAGGGHWRRWPRSGN